MPERRVARPTARRGAPQTAPDGLPRFKVCGLTRPQEAVAVARAGADAVGLVFDPRSPRAITPAAARRLVDALQGAVPTVAVLVETDPDRAGDLLAATGCSAVQLCGAQQPGDWAGFPAPILRRLAVGPGAEAQRDAWREIASLFVLDHPAGPGGTGRPVDVDHAALLARSAPCLLAGGLDERNVHARVAAVRPHGVDASSRLERAPGRKDRVRTAAFLLAARDALAQADLLETRR
jgi:phosphoribosylanthranilate isomerase